MTVGAGTPTPGVSVLLSADRPETRLGTRLAFLVAGFGLACWAPLVPFAKERLQVNDGILGLLLLCLGVGSIAAMLLTGILSARYGSRPIILAGGFGLVALLPLLAVAGSPVLLGLTLFAFGAALGSLDVAMNIHGVEVERAALRPLMSGFHALFSVGGFAGATVITFLLSLKIAPLAGTMFASVLMAIAMTFAAPRLLRASHSEQTPLIVAPHGIVLLLSGLRSRAAHDPRRRGGRKAGGGGGGGFFFFCFFAIAMTVGRLSGD